METNTSTMPSGQHSNPRFNPQQDEGESACLCGAAQLPPANKTREHSPIIEPVAYRGYQLGTSARDGCPPITLQIEGVESALPPHDDITIGRQLNHCNPWQTHVDLSRFDAHERGVSRRHLRITSRGQEVYVSDLNSTNGTWLSGQRLTPFHEYLLHDGDELRLGLLKVTIRF